MAELDCSADEGDRSPLGKGFRRQEIKICGVCGDRALGYNFNAITCESCKAFFRRNALKNKDFRCPFNDLCEVTSVTRRFCQRCRLKKCFEIGMKKEWILSEEEKQKKKRKIALNRARKINSDHSNLDGQDEVLDDLMELSHSKDPPAVMAADSMSDPTTDVHKHVGRGRPKGVRTRRRRYTEEVSSPEMYVTGDLTDPSVVEYHPAETSDSFITPKKEVVDYSISSDGVCTITSTDTGDDGSSNKSLARLYSDRESDSDTVILQSPTKRHHTSSEIPSSSVAMFEEDGLVAGLLRSASQSPNEQSGIQVFGESSTKFCNNNVEPSQINTAALSSNQIKKENYVPEKVADSSFHEIQTYNLVYPDQPTTRSCSTNIPEPCGPCGETVSSQSIVSSECDDFEFSIQEALSMLQPGNRSREPTTYTQSMMDSIVNSAISAEYSAFRLFSKISNPGELNSAERIKLHELYEANRGLLAPLCEDSNFIDLPNPSLINVINLTEIAIRRLIKMAKKISSFKTLCQEDQIGLLKAGCIELMILKSVSAYDPAKDSWKIKQDQHSFKNIKLKVLKTAPGNVYEEHKRFILAFKSEWRQDLNIMLLLSAIVLFTPERPFVVHADAIRHEQSSYLYLLKRYLECKYIENGHGQCEGRSHYYKLLERISHLHILNEDHVRVFLEANPNEMEPLLIEIFDLKQS